MRYDYDLVVIGGGSGGLVAARLAQNSARESLSWRKNVWAETACTRVVYPVRR